MLSIWLLYARVVWMRTNVNTVRSAIISIWNALSVNKKTIFKFQWTFSAGELWRWQYCTKHTHTVCTATHRRVWWGSQLATRAVWSLHIHRQQSTVHHSRYVSYLYFLLFSWLVQCGVPSCWNIRMSWTQHCTVKLRTRESSFKQAIFQNS